DFGRSVCPVVCFRRSPPSFGGTFLTKSRSMGSGFGWIAAVLAVTVSFSASATADNYLFAGWGSNVWGQTMPPPSVGGTSGRASPIAAGYDHSCATQTVSRAVVCWGDNSYGKSTPPASVDGTNGRASAVAAGGIHSCAIQFGSNAVVCWGDDAS